MSQIEEEKEKKSRRKYRKLLYLPDATMKLVDTMIENRKPKKLKKRLGKYSYNAISIFHPLAHSLPRKIERNLPLSTCDYSYGQTWGALRKAWISYKVAKCKKECDDMLKIYAHRIQKLEKELGIPTASFPNLGIIGDIFFLYDKEKEKELRRMYAEQNIVCDRFSDPDNIGLLDDDDDDTFTDLRARKRALKKYYNAFNQFMNQKAAVEKDEDKEQETIRNWEKRDKLKYEVEQIEDELVALYKERMRWNSSKQHNMLDTSSDEHKEKARKRNERARYLRIQKQLKIAELENVSAVRMVFTDKGMNHTDDVLNETP